MTYSIIPTVAKEPGDVEHELLFNDRVSVQLAMRWARDTRPDLIVEYCRERGLELVDRSREDGMVQDWKDLAMYLWAEENGLAEGKITRTEEGETP